MANNCQVLSVAQQQIPPAFELLTQAHLSFAAPTPSQTSLICQVLATKPCQFQLQLTISKDA
jgi:hypothetical protein